MEIKEIVAKMSLKEKISYCTGKDFWHTKSIPQYDISEIMLSDGPHGLRCQKNNADMIGINQSEPATCFPAAVTAGATWNEDLYSEEGKAIGEEALAQNVSVVLGPGCNIKRNPLGGRNFEYISEDPYLSGKMAAAYIRGQQSTGVSSSLKHFAVNNQEYKRQNGDSLIDDRSLREIYLKPFEIAVKEGKPDTIMCAYNKINGVHCSDNYYLLTNILRNEWGFDGAVITDWGAMNDRIEAFKAGCDLNMPGGSDYMEKDVLAAVNNGMLDEKYIDASVERILRLVEKTQAPEKKLSVNWEKHHKLAMKVAEQGAVLLKNDDQILPLKTDDIALVGYMAAHMRYQGSGSSHINPIKQTNLTELMPDSLFVSCCDENGNVTEESLKAAEEAALKHKIVIIVAGLPEVYESEAIDREHMRLPEGHDRMIERIAKVNRNTVVILLGGSPIEMPWADQVKAILYMGLPGQAGGEAAYNLLKGNAVPSGKLTETWPFTYDDVVSKETFGKKNTEYREGIYVGYRYYDTKEQNVRYPFGFGLSYTEFVYKKLKVIDDGVAVTIKNIGNYAGAEIVQVYAAPLQTEIFRARKELKGFARVELDPGEEKTIRIKLDQNAFDVWDNGWKTPGGKYNILIGASSRDIRLEEKIEVKGIRIPASDWQRGSWYETLSGFPRRDEWEKLMGHSVAIIEEPVKGQFTLDNTCMEMKSHSLIMKIQYKITENIIAKSYGGKKDMSDPGYRMTLICAVDCPLRASVISSGGAMSTSLAKGLLLMANGHWIKGICALLKK